MTTVINYGSIELTFFGRETVRDEINARTIYRKVVEDVPNEALGMWDLFAQLCSQTRTAKGLPFDPTTLAVAETATVKAAYESFLGIDKDLKNQWKAAVDSENKPVNPLLESSQDPNF